MCRLGYTERNINDYIMNHPLSCLYATAPYYARPPSMHTCRILLSLSVHTQDASVPGLHRARGRPLPAHPQRGGAQLRGAGAGRRPDHRSVLLLLPELVRHQQPATLQAGCSLQLLQYSEERVPILVDAGPAGASSQ